MRQNLSAGLTELLRKPQLSWRFLVIGLSVLIAGLTVRPAVSAAQTVAPVTVTESGLVLNRNTKTFDCLVTITNNSGATINGPLVLSIDNITPSSVNLANQDGQDSSGNPYINLAVPTSGLLAGQSISNVLLKFTNPNRVAFTFNSSVVIPTANLALSAPSAINYPYGGCSSGSPLCNSGPITVSITNNGPFPATNVYLLLMMSIASPDETYGNFYPSQGNCFTYVQPEQATCYLQNLGVGSTITVPFQMLLSAGDPFSIDLYLQDSSSPTCYYGYPASQGGCIPADVIAVTPTFTGGPNCPLLLDECTQANTACENASSDAQDACTNQLTSCYLNGPPGLGGLACTAAGWISEAAYIACLGAVCDTEGIKCSQNASDQYKSCLDHVWDDCHTWADPTHCNWGPHWTNRP